MEIVQELDLYMTILHFDKQFAFTTFLFNGFPEVHYDVFVVGCVVAWKQAQYVQLVTYMRRFPEPQIFFAAK